VTQVLPAVEVETGENLTGVPDEIHEDAAAIEEGGEEATAPKTSESK
jgi:hypothetical protein